MPRFRRLHSNNASTTLTASALAGDSVITVADATQFSSPSDDQYERATIERQSDGAIEIVNIILQPTGTTLGVERGLEGTTALDLVAGDVLSSRITAGMMDATVGGRDELLWSIWNSGDYMNLMNEVVLFGPELDLTDPADIGDITKTSIDFGISRGRFFVNEIGIIGVNVSGVTVAPSVDCPYDEEEGYLIQEAITINATHSRQRWTTIGSIHGIYQMDFTVFQATATSFVARFYMVGHYTDI